MVRVPRLAGQFLRIALVTSLAIEFPRAASAQIVTGSDGSDGAFTFVQDTGPGALPNTMTIDLGLAASGLDGMGQPITWQTPSPVAGRGVYDPFAWAVVFKYSSVDVPEAKTVRFRNHPGRPPVVWLSQTNVKVRGSVDVSGEVVSDYALTWPEPGPGGFRGGGVSHPSTFAPGFGIGGGASTTTYQNGNFAGTPNTSLGAAYGGTGMFPLIGGSGSGSWSQYSGSVGAPGGGAILIAASQRFEVASTGHVLARGGRSYLFGDNKGGSGGGIRILANEVSLPSIPAIDATPLLGGGLGRVRLEANTFLAFTTTTPPASLGTPGQVLPDATTPAVRVASVTIAGQTYSVPLDPASSFSAPAADVVLSAGGSVLVLVEARNVAPGRTCELRVATTTGNGATVIVTPPLAGTFALSTASVSVPLSIGVHALQARVFL